MESSRSGLRIAVLVPAYNAGRYLSQCLDSILAQQGVQVDVFCCDDGSADDTRAILQDYSNRCSSIHFVSQKNGGVVSALNRLLDGLPLEFGAFTIVDADDYIHPKMLATLVEAMERTGADLAECGITPVAEDATPPSGLDGQVGYERVIDDMSGYFLKRTALPGWINKNNKLYRRSAVGHLRFRPGLSFEEDYFYGCEVNAAIRRRVIVYATFYAYRSNPGSATGSIDFHRYVESAAERVRLTCEVFVNAGKIPDGMKVEFCRDLAKDAYRMLIRKNLKKNGNGSERRELFYLAGERIRNLQVHYGLKCDGLNLMQRLLWFCCRHGFYSAARALVCLT